MQVIEGFSAETALGWTAANRKQTDLSKGCYRSEPRGEIIRIQQIEIALVGRIIQLFSNASKFAGHLSVGMLN